VNGRDFIAGYLRNGKCALSAATGSAWKTVSANGWSDAFREKCPGGATLSTRCCSTARTHRKYDLSRPGHRHLLFAHDRPPIGCSALDLADIICWSQMQIDPKATVAGWPAPLVRRTPRRLGTRLFWGRANLESAAVLDAAQGHLLIRALLAEGLIEAESRDSRKLSQAGQTFLIGNSGQTGHTCDSAKGVGAIS